eukprot:jgi/Botrbrau1/13714/Bobra.250_2s0011.1
MSGEEPALEVEEEAEAEAVDYGDQPLENPGDEAPGADGGDEALPGADEMGADADVGNADPPQEEEAAAEGDEEMRQEGEEEHEEPAQEAQNGVKAAQSESDPLKLPPHGTEVFVGGVPRTATVEQLKAFAAQAGEVFDATLPVNLADKSQNRGYANLPPSVPPTIHLCVSMFGFVKFLTREAAQEALNSLTQKETARLSGRCCASFRSKDFGSIAATMLMFDLSKHKLYIGKIPRDLTKEGLETELNKHVKGLELVELLLSKEFPGQNRGFAFLEFYNHACAEQAKNVLSAPSFRLKDRQVVVSFTDSKQDANAAAQSQVKSVYVGNLPAGVTEEKLRETFASHGTVSKVVIPPAKDGKERNYGFVHFDDRNIVTTLVSNSEKGIKPSLDGNQLEIKLARPQATPQGQQQQQQQQGFGFQQTGRGRGGTYKYSSRPTSVHPLVLSCNAPGNGMKRGRGGFAAGRGGRGGAFGGGRGYGGAPAQQGYEQAYYGAAGYEDPYGAYADPYAGAYDYSGYDYSGYDASAYGAAGAATTTMVPMMLPNGQVGYVLSGAGAPAGGYATAGGAVRRTGSGGGYTGGRGGPSPGYPAGGRGGRGRGGSGGFSAGTRYRPY